MLVPIVSKESIDKETIDAINDTVSKLLSKVDKLPVPIDNVKWAMSDEMFARTRSGKLHNQPYWIICISKDLIEKCGMQLIPAVIAHEISHIESNAFESTYNSPLEKEEKADSRGMDLLDSIGMDPKCMIMLLQKLFILFEKGGYDNEILHERIISCNNHLTEMNKRE